MFEGLNGLFGKHNVYVHVCICTFYRPALFVLAVHDSHVYHTVIQAASFLSKIQWKLDGT